MKRFTRFTGTRKAELPGCFPPDDDNIIIQGTLRAPFGTDKDLIIVIDTLIIVMLMEIYEVSIFVVNNFALLYYLDLLHSYLTKYDYHYLISSVYSCQLKAFMSRLFLRSRLSHRQEYHD